MGDLKLACSETRAGISYSFPSVFPLAFVFENLPRCSLI